MSISAMTDYAFLSGICQAVLTPFSYRAQGPVTEEEKLDILAYERDMEEITAAEEWPPYDFALEL